jgi:hypothetical protein
MAPMLAASVSISRFSGLLTRCSMSSYLSPNHRRPVSPRQNAFHLHQARLALRALEAAKFIPDRLLPCVGFVDSMRVSGCGARGS